MKIGGLLNTLVIVSRLSALWALGRRHFPETIASLEHAAKAFDKHREASALHQAYQAMPFWNVSADLFAPSAANLAVTELEGNKWNDWGKPERILETLRRMGWTNEQYNHLIASLATDCPVRARQSRIERLAACQSLGQGGS